METYRRIAQGVGVENPLDEVPVAIRDRDDVAARDLIDDREQTPRVMDSLSFSLSEGGKLSDRMGGF